MKKHQEDQCSPLHGVGAGSVYKKKKKLLLLYQQSARSKGGAYLHELWPDTLPGRPANGAGSCTAASPPSSCGPAGADHYSPRDTSGDNKGFPGGTGVAKCGTNGTLLGERVWDCAATYCKASNNSNVKTTARNSMGTLTSQWEAFGLYNLGRDLGLATPDVTNTIIIPGEYNPSRKFPQTHPSSR